MGGEKVKKVVFGGRKCHFAFSLIKHSRFTRQESVDRNVNGC